MHTFKEMHELIESMAVHAHPLGGGKFKVHKVGSAVKYVKVGDEVTSSDLDDLADAGHKVKETKNPKVVKEESLDEISSELKTRYVNKAIDDHSGHNNGRKNTTPGTAAHSYFKRKEANRKKGISRAITFGEESDAHEKAEMKTLKRLEKKTDKLIDKDKAVHKKLGEETLVESCVSPAMHKDLCHKLSHYEDASSDDSHVYEYEHKQRGDGITKHAHETLTKHGFTPDDHRPYHDAGNGNTNYMSYSHKDGRKAHLVTNHKTDHFVNLEISKS